MREFMFPEANDHPSFGHQFSLHESISLAIGGELLIPKCSVIFRPVGAPWAAMPEATVNEDCHSLTSKDKVWSAQEILVATPTGDVCSSHNLDESKLGGFVVLSTDSRHHLRTLSGCEDVSHALHDRRLGH
jgi:hypothetical protein